MQQGRRKKWTAKGWIITGIRVGVQVEAVGIKKTNYQERRLRIMDEIWRIIENVPPWWRTKNMGRFNNK